MRDEAVECPRCGYDLSGMAASPKESCPLEGVCSECGLTFLWGDVLVVRQRLTSGFFEHAMRGRARAFLFTLRWSFRPGQFWRWVRLEDPIAPDRLLVFAALAPIVATLGALAVVAAGCLIGVAADHFVPSWRHIEFTELFASVAWPPAWDARNGWGPAIYGGMLGVPVAPLLLLVLGDSMRLARVRRIHLLRIIAYSVVSSAVVFVGFGLGSVLNELVSHWRWNDDRTAWIARTSGPIADVLERIGPGLGPLFGIAWLAWAMHCACRHYLRLPHALGVAAAVFVAAAILSGILGSVAAVLMMTL